MAHLSHPPQQIAKNYQSDLLPITEWEGQVRYLADDEGSVVGLVTFGDELAGYSEARSASLEHAPAVFRPNASLLPPPGTDVVLCFTVTPADEG